MMTKVAAPITTALQEEEQSSPPFFAIQGV
jgi:hypothetical protein